jgi:DNA-binding NtrC family response regulator
VETFASAHEFLASPWADVASCLILDVQLPGLSGLDLQQRLAKSGARTSIVFLSGHGDIPTSVRAIKAGALEFLTKPYADADLIAAIEEGVAHAERERAETRGRTERFDAQLKSLAGQREGGRPAIGQSAIWRAVLRKGLQVASTETTVLLQGESGTGKEVVARFIHRASPRKDGPFVALNCAALPEQLLESELFGHDRGAFTGAQVAHAGKIEQAAAGVLFLDEVAEMSPAVQAKFLRVLEEREYQRLGGTRTLKADVRVLAATNCDLRAAIAGGTFREDLYYRLAVFDIALPPLRERPRDIALLTDAFLEAIGRLVGRAAAVISDEAREKLLAYSWPGNVRELRNAIERAVILAEGGLITSEHLPLDVGSASAAFPTASLVGSVPKVLPSAEAAEYQLIREALARSGNNKAKAARLLGLTRAQLRSRIEKHGLMSKQ